MRSTGRGRASWRRQWDVQTIALHPRHGFRLLEAKAEYVRRSRKLVLTVSLRKPRDDCFGPVTQHKRLIRWPDGRDIPLVRKAVAHELALMLRLLEQRKWPEPDVYLAQCNRTGMDIEDFSEKFCTLCTFPTCTLRE